MFEQKPEVLTTDEVAAFLRRLPDLDVDGVGDAERIDQVALLESVKAACAAAQARASAAFAESRMAARATDGVPTRERGRGLGAEIALARRDSPHRGSRHLGFARAMVRELPHTMAHLAAGRISEWRATLVCRETACLSVDDRAMVDAALAQELPSMSDGQVDRAARALAARLDPGSVTARAARAEGDRCVTLRPAPDTMTYLTAVLPVTQGVAAYAALRQHAAALVAVGNDRTRGQLMADTLVERLTGQIEATAVPLEVGIVMPADTLAGHGDEPAEVVGYGPVSAEAARDLLAAAVRSEAGLWFRRLYTTPDGTQLATMDSRRRLFPPALRHFLALRDKRCRTPWCNAPISHHDHVQPASRGGPTSTSNGQRLCTRCNLGKELPGWQDEVVADGCSPGDPHRVRLRTPTGHSYDSTAPPLLEARRGTSAPPGRRAVADISRLEHHLTLLLDCA